MFSLTSINAWALQSLFGPFLDDIDLPTNVSFVFALFPELLTDIFCLRLKLVIQYYSSNKCISCIRFQFPVMHPIPVKYPIHIS